MPSDNGYTRMADSNSPVANTASLEDPSKYRRSVVRGIVGNGVSLAILFGVTRISQHLLLPTAISLSIQWAVFAFHGLPLASEKYFDLSGSFTHLAVVLSALMTCPGGASPQQVCFGLLSTVWLVRLGTFLYLRILRDGKDERFDELKKVPLRFLAVWTIQALWVILVQMPVILVCSVEDPGSSMCYLVNSMLLLVWLAAFLVQCVADVQKYEFRSDPANRHRFITHGLWRYSRHPNYFGEILMWTAAAAAASVFGMSSSNSMLFFAWLSPAFTTFLLLKVSGVPLVTAAGRRKWGEDKEWNLYMKNTSMLVPWRPAEAL